MQEEGADTGPKGGNTLPAATAGASGSTPVSNGAGHPNSITAKIEEKNPTNSYVFDEKGYYVRTEKNDKSANLVIENSVTKDKSTFEFNDPKTDVAAIEYNLKNLGEEEFKETKFVFTVSDKRIGEMMKESRVEYKNYVSRRIFTSTESTGGKMDFTAYHLSVETSHGANDVWDFDTELLKDKGPIFIMGDQKKAYNMFDAGNFLWGNAVNRLGGSSVDAKSWSLWNDPNDSQADQRAIQNGWFYQAGFRQKLYLYVKMMKTKKKYIIGLICLFLLIILSWLYVNSFKRKYHNDDIKETWEKRHRLQNDSLEQ